MWFDLCLIGRHILMRHIYIHMCNSHKDEMLVICLYIYLSHHMIKHAAIDLRVCKIYLLKGALCFLWLNYENCRFASFVDSGGTDVCHSTLEPERYHEADFFVSDSSGSCRYDNLQCQQRQKIGIMTTVRLHWCYRYCCWCMWLCVPETRI